MGLKYSDVLTEVEINILLGQLTVTSKLCYGSLICPLA